MTATTRDLSPEEIREAAARAVAEMSRADLINFKRQLTETAARRGIRLNNTTSPGQMAVKLEPGTQRQRPHLEKIDEVLTGMLAKPNSRCMIFTPTQVGKSTRGSQWFPFWWTTIRPRDRILMVSAESRLALRNAAVVRELVKQYGHEYGIYLSPDESSKADWSTTAGGSMRSRGIRANLIGQPMDLGIIDDPFTGRAQAESRLVRDSVWDWYSSVWSSRKSPTYREVLITTRWHKDDLAGRLLAQDGRAEEGGAWTVLHLPAIALPEDHDRGIYPDPLGRAPGEPLTHPLIDPDDDETWNGAPSHSQALINHWAMVKAASTARDWNAMHLGVPATAEGAILSEQQVRNATGPVPDEIRRRVVGVDPSGGGRDSAGIVGGVLDADGKMWWTHDRTAVMSSFDWSREACLLAHEMGAERIVVETNYGGDQATTLIRQAWAQLQTEETIPETALCPLVVEVKAKVSKVLRAEPIAQAVITGRAGFDMKADVKQLKSEWQMWEPGSTWSPGALDAGVYVAMELLPAMPRGAKSSNPSKKRRGEQGSGPRGGVAARRRGGTAA